MSTFTMLEIGGTHFVLRKPEDAAKVLTILSSAVPVEEHFDRDTHKSIVRPVEHSFSHRVTVTTRPLTEMQSAPAPKRAQRVLRLDGGAT